MPIGRHNGSDNMLIWAKLPPGASRQKHRYDNSEMVYYVIRGRGLAGAARIAPKFAAATSTSFPGAWSTSSAT